MVEVIEAADAKLRNLTSLNVIVGRNGSGKSRFFRSLASSNALPEFAMRYISPERTGAFELDAGISNNMRKSPDWLDGDRRKNQPDRFKMASRERLHDLAFIFFEKLEGNAGGLRKDLDKTFATVQLAKLNAMLSNVYITRSGQNFIVKTHDEEVVGPANLSSGESEILSLGTEILHFFESCQGDKINVLLLDEPDVHLHPDLQARLARFLVKNLEELPAALLDRVHVCIATHSMPLVSQCATYHGCSIGAKSFGSTEVELKPASAELRKLAPFFGHPLSMMIGNDLPLIIEGEDDEQIWQQAGRTADGRLKIFPCVAHSVDNQTALERECDRFMSAIYDDPRAISIRDGDGKTEGLEAIGCVERYRLQCYAAENLLLTDEVLAMLGTDWLGFKDRAARWLRDHEGHEDRALVHSLMISTDRLRHSKIKDIRTLIPCICDSNKPWAFLVGQAIGRLKGGEAATNDSLVEYVGENALRALGLRPDD